jgi:hypothetical protein
MVQSSSDADSSSDRQEIDLMFSPLSDPFLRKTILICIFKNYFFTINFNIILRSIPKPSKCCPPLRYSKILYMFLISAKRNTHVCPFYLNFLQMIKRMMSGEQCKLWSSSLRNSLHPPFTFCSLGAKNTALA